MFDKQALDQFFGGNEDRAINLTFTSGMQLPLSKLCFENGEEIGSGANPGDNNNGASVNGENSPLKGSKQHRRTETDPVDSPSESSDESSVSRVCKPKAPKKKRTQPFISTETDHGPVISP